MYLLDSNILIYYLNGNEEVRHIVEQKDPIFISAISVTELLAKASLSKRQQERIESFLERFSLIELDYEIAHKAAELKRKYRLKVPDAILAASAINYRLILVSRDKIFSRIRECKTVNPFSERT